MCEVKAQPRSFTRPETWFLWLNGQKFRAHDVTLRKSLYLNFESLKKTSMRSILGVTNVGMSVY